MANNTFNLRIANNGDLRFVFSTVKLVFMPPSIQGHPPVDHDFKNLRIGNNDKATFVYCFVQLLFTPDQDFMNLCGGNYGNFNFNFCTMKPISVEPPSAGHDFNINLRAGNDCKFCFNFCTIQPIKMQWLLSAQIHPAISPPSPPTLSLPSLEEESPDDRSQRNKMPPSKPSTKRKSKRKN